MDILNVIFIIIKLCCDKFCDVTCDIFVCMFEIKDWKLEPWKVDVDVTIIIKVLSLIQTILNEWYKNRLLINTILKTVLKYY